MRKTSDISEKPYFEKIIKNNKPEKGRQDRKRHKTNHRNNNK